MWEPQQIKYNIGIITYSFILYVYELIKKKFTLILHDFVGIVFIMICGKLVDKLEPEIIEPIKCIKVYNHSRWELEISS